MSCDGIIINETFSEKMGDVAAAVLAAQAQKEKQLPSISVEKPIGKQHFDILELL